MMPIRSLSVQGYRSIKNVRLQLKQVNVLVGPNGCGKTNLYRSLYLLTAAADGRFARTLATEGGMASALWAGEQRQGTPKRITVEVGFDRWKYHFACGLPQPNHSAFHLDPLIRNEELWFNDGTRNISLFRRENASAHLRNEAGNVVSFPGELTDAESILSELREPHRFPELSALRSTLLSWRFYHQFRTDAESPLRRPQVAVQTPVLSHNGADLAAALQTILEIGDRDALKCAVADAFSGGRLLIAASAGGMEVSLEMPEFRRPFRSSELSDGTLKYLCLTAALLSPRPPTLLALNEPDANLHPQLHKPLARMIVNAGSHSQLWITTHSEALAALIQENGAGQLIRLEKQNGATIVAAGRREPQTEETSSDEMSDAL
jgi:predicted ATPase